MGKKELRRVPAFLARDDVDGGDGGEHAPAQADKIAVFKPVVVHELKDIHAGQVEHLPDDPKPFHHAVEQGGVVGDLRIQQKRQDGKSGQGDRPDERAFPVETDLVAQHRHARSPPSL